MDYLGCEVVVRIVKVVGVIGVILLSGIGWMRRTAKRAHAHTNTQTTKNTTNTHIRTHIKVHGPISMNGMFVVQDP